ncbi:MAG: hypothetical protein A3G24_17745 [Betaproteobacteria bacterium RIFCSPLOWO2_12_FULL_62_13]|nr:MAG: hypothetical protein A3G24_17745 [Betaproteobacteria bacterium RIFCSPLOWO2_12_FULL_62_13]
MKRLFAIIAGLLVIAFTVSGCTNRPPVLNDEGWITLFDGTEASLNNWNRVGDANWKVYRGAVEADKRAGKTPGYLVSKNSYTDFQLRVGFWVSHDANSGIFMRCADPKKITDRSCYEANIFDRRPDPLYGTGAIVHLAAVHPMPKAGGKWNTYEITVKGNRISLWLNGDLTVDLVDNKFASGPFALQYGSGVVKFRKVQIRPL